MMNYSWRSSELLLTISMKSDYFHFMHSHYNKSHLFMFMSNCGQKVYPLLLEIMAIWILLLSGILLSSLFLVSFDSILSILFFSKGVLFIGFLGNVNVWKESNSIYDLLSSKSYLIFSSNAQNLSNSCFFNIFHF